MLLRTERGAAFLPSLGDPEVDLHVPELCDVEVVSALRGLVRRGRVETERARQALVDYLDLPLTHHGHAPLLERVFDLRERFSAYDAAYVALAEVLGARILSGDERLVRSLQGFGEGGTD